MSSRVDVSKWVNLPDSGHVNGGLCHDWVNHNPNLEFGCGIIIDLHMT